MKNKQFQSGNALITIALQNQWENGYIAHVTIQNEGEKPINDWGLEAEINGTIDNVWNANLSENHQKGVAILVNAGWNRTIQAGQSATIGIKVEQASFDDFASILLTQSSSIR